MIIYMILSQLLAIVTSAKPFLQYYAVYEVEFSLYDTNFLR